MKIKKILLAAAFITTTLPCQAMLTPKTILQLTVLGSLSYTGYKLCIAEDKESKRWQRIVRQDKNKKIDTVLKIIHKNCDYEYCKTIAKTLEQLKSSEVQILQDNTEEFLEFAGKTVEDSTTHITQTMKQKYNEFKNELEQSKKSKK